MIDSILQSWLTYLWNPEPPKLHDPYLRLGRQSALNDAHDKGFQVLMETRAAMHAAFGIQPLIDACKSGSRDADKDAEYSLESSSIPSIIGIPFDVVHSGIVMDLEDVDGRSAYKTDRSENTGNLHNDEKVENTFSGT